MNTNQVTVRLNDEISFQADISSSILQAAIKSGITLEHSCLSGRCQSCKAKLNSGETELMRPELGLGDQEMRNSFILTCSRKALSDLDITVESYIYGVLETPRTFPAKVNSIIQHSEDLIELGLRLPPTVNFKFEPGQYVNIIRGSIKRSYSIANLGQDGMLLFYIRRYQSGEMSEYFFSDMKENDLLRLEGPFGTFFYRESNIKNLIFMATGTGIAPVSSILQYLDENPDLVIRRNVYLFWGNREESDVFWVPDFQNIDVKYFQCFSRLSEESTVTYSGYVQEVLLRQSIELTDSEIYACGSVEMIDDALSQFILKGGNRRNFKSDAFLISK